MLRKSGEELVDEMIAKAGGVGWLHLVIYIAISQGINCIVAFIFYQVPFFVQK